MMHMYTPVTHEVSIVETVLGLFGYASLIGIAFAIPFVVCITFVYALAHR